MYEKLDYFAYNSSHLLTDFYFSFNYDFFNM